ncbi:hypothetical protein GCM10010896_10060 [Mammaliicoccus stepanovicii]|nr:hypothetical protein CD111_08715 [Mammaliicoccus stepanovicii]GGI40777.1 hypothetical protein GCM10010896_10060 [Mammaliicoccus stepanovicii]
MPFESSEDIPKSVNVKTYKGQYMGDHHNDNKVFLKKYKKDAERVFKEYAKDTFDTEMDVTQIYSYTNGSKYGSYPAIVTIGRAKGEYPFQLYLRMRATEDNKLTVFMPSISESAYTGAPIASMIYKRYQKEFDAAHKNFKQVVEKEGYYAMNETLTHKKDASGIIDDYMTIRTTGVDDGETFKKDFLPVMKLKGQAYNDAMDELMEKYPIIKSQLNTEFNIYYDKSKIKTEQAADYLLELQKKTYKDMKRISGEKTITASQNKINPQNLEPISKEFNIDGGMIYD